MTADLPEEFRSRPDTYEGIVPAFVDAAYYKDGQLVHSTLREAPEVPEEEQPGWTVQGSRRGQAA
ncbi:hypothetical protein ACFYP4_02525 [Streptomyces sp. NPDC005551]|uniref:hypothetical protein n=1 Tax=Streptomyces sp. NPDC005551 TaxID=3364725 RepID=UPI00367FF53F